jgi:hypothetical protein
MEVERVKSEWLQHMSGLAPIYLAVPDPEPRQGNV